MQAGVLLTLLFAWNGSQTFEGLEAKQSVMIHCVKVTPTFISITGAHILTIVHSVISVMAILIVEMLFILFSVTLCNGLKMSEYEVCWLMDFPLIIYCKK